jgi:hypothetical protein
MNSTAKEIGHLRAIEQAQQSLEFAAVVGGGVELEGKSASIKSSSECIQSSNASPLSSCCALTASPVPSASPIPNATSTGVPALLAGGADYGLRSTA